MAEDCPACNAHGSLEYVAELGTLACTRCGTVSSSSASHAFELLQRVDAEDEFQNGRTECVLQTEADLYIRRLLTRFDLQSALRDRTRHLFERAKARLDFRWGRKAEIFAAACVYVAAREAGKPIWLLELASLIEVKDVVILTRAIKVVKYELKLEYEDNDPALFLERLLVHLKTVFSHTGSTASTGKSPPLPPLHNSADKRKTTFSPANTAWVRTLQLPAVRDLATGLLALTTSLSLTAGRRAESVACAIVIAALEGAARRPAPVVQEFADELAWLLGVASYTVMERCRDINRLLVDYAAKLPWNVAAAAEGGDDDSDAEVTAHGKRDKRRKKKKKVGEAPARVARKVVKTEVVAFTADIVALRKQLANVKTPKPLKRKFDEDDAGAPLTISGLTGVGNEEEDGDEGAFMADPLLDQSAADRYYGSRANSPSVGPDYNYDDGGGSDDASAAVPFSPASLSASPPALPAPAPAPAPAPPAPPASGPGPARTTGKPTKPKRPARYTRDGPPKRQRVVTGGGAARASPSDPPTPAPPLVPGAADAQIRQLLLAGLDLEAATRHLRGLGSTDAVERSLAAPRAQPTTRLERLLWLKPADEITDAELFDPGELEAYVRSREETAVLLRLPRAREMIEVDEKHAAGREARALVEGTGSGSGRKGRHGYRFSAPRDEKGDFLPPPGAAASARRGAGTRASTAETDGFRPRKKQSKIVNRAALEAYLAAEALSDDDPDADGDAGGGEAQSAEAEKGEEWRIGMALQAAQDEGEDVAHEDDEEDDADEAEGGADDENDWRKAYGGYRAVEEDDNGEGDDAY